MKYVFCITAGITLGIEVEADSLEEAVAKAKAADVTNLCHSCAQGTLGRWGANDIDCGPPGDHELEDAHGCDFAQAEAIWQEGDHTT